MNDSCINAHHVGIEALVTTGTVDNSHERFPLQASWVGNHDPDEQYIDPVATMLWIECGSCSGESMAILGAEGPGREGYNLLDFLEHNQVHLL